MAEPANRSGGREPADRLAVGPVPRTGARATVAAAALAGLLVTAVAVLALHSSYRAGLDAAEREVRSVTAMFQEHVRLAVSSLDRTLAASAERALAASPGDPALNRFLMDRQAEHPAARILFAIDGQGRIIMDSHSPNLAVGVSVRDREYFSAHLAGREALFVSRPLVNRVDKTRSIVLSRGAGQGSDRVAVAAAIVDLGYFRNVFAPYAAAKGRAGALLHAGGEAVTSTAPGDAAPGGVLAPGNSGVAYVESDGRRWVVGRRVVDPWPLVVVYALDRDEALAAFRLDLIRTAILLAVALLVIALAARHHLRHARELARETARLHKLALELRVANNDLERENEELRKSEETYRLLVETIPDLFWLRSPGLRALVYASPGYEALFGREREALYRHPESFLEGVHPDDRERLRQALAENAGTGWDVRYRVVRPDGVVKEVRDRAFPVLDGHGKTRLMAGVVAEVSEGEAVAGDDSRTSPAGDGDTAATDMVEAVWDYVGRVLDMAGGADEEPDDQDLLARLATFRKRGAPLLEVVRGAADLAGLESGRLSLASEPFSLRRSLARAVKAVSARAADKGVRFSVSMGPGTPDLVRGDAARLERIISVLSRNAVRFTDSGHVEVQVRAPEGRGPGREVELAFTVRDTGRGAPAEALNAFFKARKGLDRLLPRKAGAPGLGLAVAKRLVDMMGGRIVVTGGPGQGSAFTFTVALKAEEEPAGADAQARERKAVPKGGRVLLAEAEGAERDQRKQALAEAGHEVATVSRGREVLAALALAAKAGKPFAAAVLAWNMEGMDALEVVGQVRQGQVAGCDTDIFLVGLVRETDGEAAERLLAGGADAVTSTGPGELVQVLAPGRGLEP